MPWHATLDLHYQRAGERTTLQHRHSGPLRILKSLYPEGEAVLKRRGIEVLPDVLANAGGVTVSYYEWVQNKRSESWSLEEVDERLERAMIEAYDRMQQFAELHQCDYRIACYGVALERLKKVYEEREIFP